MWHESCEKAVNKQIQMEYWASYQYHIIWSYFDRNTIGLNNIAEFFRKSSEEEREHAHKLMEYQNMRGGTVSLDGIEKVDLDFLSDKSDTKSDVLLALEKALEMEVIVYKSLLNVHNVGEKCTDPQFTDFIEGEYLEEQVKAIQDISKMISQVKRIGNDGHGIWNFDQNFKA